MLAGIPRALRAVYVGSVRFGGKWPSRLEIPPNCRSAGVARLLCPRSPRRSVLLAAGWRSGINEALVSCSSPRWTDGAFKTSHFHFQRRLCAPSPESREVGKSLDKALQKRMLSGLKHCVVNWFNPLTFSGSKSATEKNEKDKEWLKKGKMHNLEIWQQKYPKK